MVLISFNSRRRQAVACGAALATLMLAAACEAGSPFEGNVGLDDLSSYDSVGFVLDGGEYSFFAMPGASWTRIIGLDESSDRALVWFRDDSDTGYGPAVLDLETMDFTELAIDGLDGFFARGFTADGRIVGGVSEDDLVYGVVYDLDTDDVTRFERTGFDFTGVSDVRGETILGYTDAGMSTFVWSDGEFAEVYGDGANRLLGNQMNDDGVIVGFASWHDDPLWDPLNRGFIARPGDGGYLAEPFGLSGMARTTVTGVDDEGRIAGHVNADAESPMVAYTAELVDPDATFTLFPLPESAATHLSTPGTGTAVWGMDAGGRLFGTVFVTDPEPELWDDEAVCGGHGHLHGVECHCDPGYVQDQDDPGVCLLDES